jgi:hypothetical protein
VVEKLRLIADEQRDQIEAELVEARLNAAHGYQKAKGTPLDRLRQTLSERVRVATEQASEIEAVVAAVHAELEGDWNDRYSILMNAKSALPQLLTLTPFRSLNDLLAAEQATLRDGPGLDPPGLAALRVRLQRLGLAAAAGAPLDLGVDQLHAE